MSNSHLRLGLSLSEEEGAFRRPYLDMFDQGSRCLGSRQAGIRIDDPNNKYFLHSTPEWNKLLKLYSWFSNDNFICHTWLAFLMFGKGSSRLANWYERAGKLQEAEKLRAELQGLIPHYNDLVAQTL